LDEGAAIEDIDLCENILLPVFSLKLVTKLDD
jgi:hypothetical protein